MKDDKKSGENTHEKFFWIIGISVIVFMILLLGSLIGLKMTRDKLGNITGFQMFESQKSNYEVLSDGTMRNNNKDVLGAEIDVDNVRFSHFSITQKDIAESGNSEMTYDTDISFEIENMDEKVIESATFIVSLYDSTNAKLIDFTIQLNDLLAREPIIFRQNLNKSCVDTADITVERIK